MIRGLVVDQLGQPVGGADVDFIWRSNGSGRDMLDKMLDLQNETNRREYWGHVGKMAPGRAAEAGEIRQTGPNGRFSLSIKEAPAFTLMAMDRDRTRGGLVVIPKNYAGAELEIRLGPLVRVYGSFTASAADRRLGWTCADISVPDDPERPADYTRLTGCGSYDARFEFRLPAGRYYLHGYNDDLEWPLELAPPRVLVLTEYKTDVDLGAIGLSEKHSSRFKERQARREGTLGDYRKHFGKQPPRWHATDARGVKKDVELSAFKGKWLLLDFWGLSCSVCLRKTIPELIAFYEDHAADRDRFEILSICIDPDGELQSVDDLDRHLQPFVKHVWQGKTIPFPILLDSTFETWQNFGIPGLGFELLVDPDGNLVDGDRKTLAEKLKQ
jgi:hypothetical protein